MNIRPWTCFALGVLLAVGCSHIGALKIYNNSGDAVTVIGVVGVDKRHPNGTHTNRTELLPGASGFAAITAEFEVRGPKGVWKYEPGPTEVSWRPYHRYEGRFMFALFQLEADGALYVLRTNEVPPVTAFSAQPPGFPLHPVGK